MEKKKMIVLILAVILVVLVLLGLFFNKKEKLNINSELVQELYKKVNPSEDGGILSSMYGNSGKFDNQYILAVGFKNIINKKDSFVQTVAKEELESSIREIFGETIKFTHESAYLLVDEYCPFNYDEDINQYEAISGCGGDWYNYYYRKIIDAVESKNELVITEKSIYVNYDWGDSYSYINIYNNVIEKSLIKTYANTSGESNQIKIDDYLDKASTYKYTFKKVGDKYIFKSFDLVKR